MEIIEGAEFYEDKIAERKIERFIFWVKEKKKERKKEGKPCIIEALSSLGLGRLAHFPFNKFDPPIKEA